MRQLRLKEQQMRAEALRKRLLSVRNRANLVFRYYATEAAIAYSQTFEERHHISESIDLKFFMKFVKEFDLLSKRSDLYELSSMFKKVAVNGLWLTIDQFYEMLVGIYNREHVNEKGQPLPYTDTDFIGFVNAGVLNR